MDSESWSRSPSAHLNSSCEGLICGVIWLTKALDMLVVLPFTRMRVGSLKGMSIISWPIIHQIDPHVLKTLLCELYQPQVPIGAIPGLPPSPKWDGCSLAPVFGSRQLSSDPAWDTIAAKHTPGGGTGVTRRGWRRPGPPAGAQAARTSSRVRRTGPTPRRRQWTS